MLNETFMLNSEAGMHARLATLIVNKAAEYRSDLKLTYGERTVNLKSIMAVMSLKIPKYAAIKIEAAGEDEEKAMTGMTEVISKHFHE